jgi:hypothetical protein
MYKVYLKNLVCIFRFEYITDYLLDGQFPGKLQWKRVVSLAVQSCQQQSWTSRVTAHS